MDVNEIFSARFTSLKIFGWVVWVRFAWGLGFKQLPNDSIFRAELSSKSSDYIVEHAGVFPFTLQDLLQFSYVLFIISANGLQLNAWFFFRFTQQMF